MEAYLLILKLVKISFSVYLKNKTTILYTHKQRRHITILFLIFQCASRNDDDNDIPSFRVVSRKLILEFERLATTVANIDSYEVMSDLDCGDGRCRDMFWEFIYIVVIPGGVLFLVVFITSILMCCAACSCKRKKQYSVNDETQILRYNSIRRASLNLRHLSHNRDTPLLSSRADRDARTASLNLDRDQRYRRGGRGTASAPGTLQRDRDRRHNRNRHSEIPPQYSTPPRYPSSDAVNIGSGVEYAELHHGITQARAATNQDRINT